MIVEDVVRDLRDVFFLTEPVDKADTTGSTKGVCFSSETKTGSGSWDLMSISISRT